MDSNINMVLATDIDGTFLAPNGATEPSELYRLIKDHTDSVILIFVTGRGFESIIPLLDDPVLPRPDYIIADVGATILKKSNDNYVPVMSLQSDIATGWTERSLIIERLEGVNGLVPQEVPQERRCSFYYDNPAVIAELESIAIELNLSLIASAGKYVDFLPKGVDKGSSLIKLLKEEDLPQDRVMVAGDTLNDYSMLEIGFKGCVVGNSEPNLKDMLKSRRNIYIAEGEGPAGILEAMHHHGFSDTIDRPSIHKPSYNGKAELVMVYHRQPFDESVQGNKQVRQNPKSPNGIIPTLLGFFSNGQAGAWVAWSQQKNRSPKNFEIYTDVDKDNYPNLIAARVALTADDVNLFYKQFSKESFWPIIFSFPGRASFIEDHWKRFCEINKLFAERAADVAADGATVWIHDYNLWMVPSYLRDIRPDLKIAFFHHTSFPGADIFNIIPWKREIIASLLRCDYIGFHIPRYVVNFIDVACSNVPVEVLKSEVCAPTYLTYGCALGVEEMPRKIKTPYGTLGVGAHPVGVDNAKIAAIAASQKNSIEEIQQEAAGKKIILSVERLDYVKGSIEKMLAFEAFLEKHPEWHDKVMMINITTPAASGMDVYRATREKLDQTVGRINGRYSKIDWTPIKYFFRSIPFEELISYYVAADVAWITPLRDGLNLVCKEYISAKAATSRPGVLILSEFAGAAVELKGAILVNPYDINGMIASLVMALNMDDREIDFRMNDLKERVYKYDVNAWGEDFLNFCSET